MEIDHTINGLRFCADKRLIIPWVVQRKTFLKSNCSMLL